MGWLSIALNSSIGKKFVMALTGICLILFLVIHLINNLTLFAGPELFNTVVKGLDSIKPLIRVVEVILALIFIFHIYEGVRLWWENKKARPVSYAVNGSSKNSDIYSRTAIWTGSIVFIFLVIHLRTLWVTFNFDSTVKEGHQYYNAVVSVFQNPYYAFLYVIAVILLGFHLNHGFQSAFQTFGWNHKKYFPFIKRLGFIYSLLTALAFASIPIYFLFFFGGK